MNFNKINRTFKIYLTNINNYKMKKLKQIKKIKNWKIYCNKHSKNLEISKTCFNKNKIKISSSNYKKRLIY
jgi:hypothetical protein